MLFSGEPTFADFLADALAIFVLILWFWLFITTASDLFRRHDISGFGKVMWVILLIVLPYIGIFAYIFTQGGGMAERNRLQARQARDELRQAVGFSAADELRKVDRLVSENSIRRRSMRVCARGSCNSLARGGDTRLPQSHGRVGCWTLSAEVSWPPFGAAGDTGMGIAAQPG